MSGMCRANDQKVGYIAATLSKRWQARRDADTMVSSKTSSKNDGRCCWRFLHFVLRKFEQIRIYLIICKYVHIIAYHREYVFNTLSYKLPKFGPILWAQRHIPSQQMLGLTCDFIIDSCSKTRLTISREALVRFSIYSTKRRGESLRPNTKMTNTKKNESHFFLDERRRLRDALKFSLRVFFWSRIQLIYFCKALQHTTPK